MKVQNKKLALKFRFQIFIQGVLKTGEICLTDIKQKAFFFLNTQNWMDFLVL